MHSYGKCLHNREWPFGDKGTDGWGDFQTNLNKLLPKYKFEVVIQVRGLSVSGVASVLNLCKCKMANFALPPLCTWNATTTELALPG